MNQEILNFIPKQPREPQDLGRILDTVEDLLIKNLYLTGEMSGSQITKVLRVPLQIVNRILKLLQEEDLLTVIGAAKTGGVDLGGDFTYALYAKGIEKAKNL